MWENRQKVGGSELGRNVMASVSGSGIAHANARGPRVGAQGPPESRATKTYLGEPAKSFRVFCCLLGETADSFRMFCCLLDGVFTLKHTLSAPDLVSVGGPELA